MLRRSRFLWKLLIANALAIGLSLAFFLWTAYRQLDRLGDEARSLHRTLLVSGAFAALIGVALTFLLASLWTNRIRRMTALAQSIARGGPSLLVPVDGADEVAALGRAINRMSERIRRQLQVADRQRRMLESLLARLQESVVIVAADGRIVLYNKAAERMLGLPHQVGIIADRDLNVEQWLPNHDILSLISRKSPAGDAPEDVTGADDVPIDEIKTEMLTAKGAIVVLARASDLPIPDSESDGAREPDARIMARLVVLRDISDLDRTIKLRTDFVANASHELRTPLSAIRGAVETLSRINPATDGADAARFLDVIARHSSRLESMVSDLLDLSRLESGGARFESADINLRQVFADLVERWRDALSAKELNIRSDIAPNCQIIAVKRHLLDLSLDNLVDNAIKFSDPRKSIRLNAGREAESVIISVEDEGCGIPPEHQERVFERFYQVDPGRGGDFTRGTGLGLSIVRHAVLAMGGQVHMESAVGRGTRMTLRLPREPTPANDRPKAR